MILPPDELVLLDTSVVVHLIRLDIVGRKIENLLGLSGRAEKPLFSSITEGEIRGLAHCWGWGPAKHAALDTLLRELVRVDAGHALITSAYAELYADGRPNGHPCGENDLWIAATAKVTGSTLITCDRDFDWMHGKHINRIYVRS